MLGVTPVFESRDGTSETTCLLVKCFCDISCIRLKFSREFVVSTAVVSLLSVLTVSEQTANALYIGVLSV